MRSIGEDFSASSKIEDCMAPSFISDAHEGLKTARSAIFPTVPWQRCQFHLQQNAQQYVPRQKMKQEVADRIRAIFTAPDNQEALRLLAAFLADYRKDAPRVATLFPNTKSCLRLVTKVDP